VIAGSGRSGTTWILDVIASATNLRTVFEPLHPVVGAVAGEFANRYISPSADPPRLRSFMDKLFKGEMRGLWTDYRVIPDRLLPTTRILVSQREAYTLYTRYRDLCRGVVAFRWRRSEGIAVKFIRANLMLEWIRYNYDVKILFALRHPCAVIESKLRLDAAAKKAGLHKGAADWDPFSLLERYFSDGDLGRDFIDNIKAQIDTAQINSVEAHALVWCIENARVLKSVEKNADCLVYYEHLVTNGRGAWMQVFEKLGYSGELTDAWINEPSQQASQDFKESGSKKARISRWLDRLSEQDKQSIQRIFDIFDIKVYSAFDPLPTDQRVSKGL